ncbi:hypothetical protein F5B18DRAFT_62117 [Nemania serpens]|nr:hypothetical protein F5B18DRAFT_62117 [Nemania serpens]
MSSTATEITEGQLASLHLQCIANAKTWFQRSLEGAQWRVDFMMKYPDAFDKDGTDGHVGAARHNLESARHAYEIIQSFENKERSRQTGESGQ